MNPLNLSDSNRTVIIDDGLKDGAGIRDALTSKHISSLFIHATSLDAFPDKPFQNVRLVFLDLEMIAVGNAKSKASLALTYLNKVVAPDSFYVLVIWTTHLGSELEQEFLSMLETRSPKTYPCVVPIPLSKDSCKKRNGDYSIDKINTSIRKQFKKISNYSLFIKWESTINETMSHFLNDIVAKEDERNLSRKLHGLAEAYGGSGYKNDVAKNSLLALNDALKGSIDSGIVSKDYADNNDRIYKRVGKLDLDAISDINAHLMINPEKLLGPGCVFKAPSIDSRYTGTLLKKRVGVRGIEDVMIDITSICDVAQDKHHFSTYLYGIIVPIGHKAGTGGYVYEFKNPFKYKNKNVKLIVNLKAVQTIIKLDSPTRFETRRDRSGNQVIVLREASPTEDINRVVFKLRDTVVSDLQNRASGHHSRLGHVLLS